MPAIMTYDFMCGLAQYAKVREQPSKQRKVTTLGSRIQLRVLHTTPHFLSTRRCCSVHTGVRQGTYDVTDAHG